MPEAEEVLVVEDHAPIRELVRAVLEGAGYAVREAADGAAALALARRAPPAVILLDVDLPVLDGPGFLAAYRRAPGPHAPVVLMTAAGPAGRAAGSRAGAAGHLGKPFGLAALLCRPWRRSAAGAGRRPRGGPGPGAAPRPPGRRRRVRGGELGKPRSPARAGAPAALPLALLGLLLLLLPVRAGPPRPGAGGARQPHLRGHPHLRAALPRGRSR